ncbi:MAG: hypothetical protein CVV05_01415 [Gammaproteobacteria bacterium HGW-Gammaproteobacteria-1]|jgi:hypothetical protein|nr:MAG: hypothetical protein CVV05_01415 [Gammaproteobacteria bacterium HGW-Gammaproteobacteria-1]
MNREEKIMTRTKKAVWVGVGVALAGTVALEMAYRLFGVADVPVDIGVVLTSPFLHGPAMGLVAGVLWWRQNPKDAVSATARSLGVETRFAPCDSSEKDRADAAREHNS